MSCLEIMVWMIEFKCEIGWVMVEKYQLMVPFCVALLSGIENEPTEAMQFIIEHGVLNMAQLLCVIKWWAIWWLK